MAHPDSVWVKNSIHKLFCEARLQLVGPHLSASVIFPLQQLLHHFASSNPAVNVI